MSKNVFCLYFGGAGNHIHKGGACAGCAVQRENFLLHIPDMPFVYGLIHMDGRGWNNQCCAIHGNQMRNDAAIVVDIDSAGHGKRAVDP